MTWKSLFVKEVRIRLTEEGDGFVATQCYRVRYPKVPGYHLRQIIRFVRDEAIRKQEEQIAPGRLDSEL
jgi:hypothetical protein